MSNYSQDVTIKNSMKLIHQFGAPFWNFLTELCNELLHQLRAFFWNFPTKIGHNEFVLKKA